MMYRTCWLARLAALFLCVGCLCISGGRAEAASVSVACLGGSLPHQPTASANCAYAPSSEYLPGHDGGLWVNVDLLHAKLNDLKALRNGTTQQPIVAGGTTTVPPVALVHAQICLSDPDVAYNSCPNNYPDNAANDPYRYQLNPKIIPLLSKGLDNIRRAGLKLVLRFTYNWPCGSGTSDSVPAEAADTSSASNACPPGNDNDAPIDVILDHIKQLAPVIQQNADLIYAFQAGFIGQWGEWHNSTNENDDKQIHNVFLDQFTQLFSPYMQLEVRRPYVVMDYATHRFLSTDDAHIVALGLGMHDDEFGSNLNDAGTFSPEMAPDPDPTPYTTCQLRHTAAIVGKNFTMTGETSAIYDFKGSIIDSNTGMPCDSSIPTPSDYTGFASAYSLSSLQLKFAPDVWSAWLSPSSGSETPYYNTILHSVGPHISLVSAAFQASASGTTRVTLSLQNTGWSAIPNSRGLWVYVTQAGADPLKQQVPVDLSKIAPGATVSKDVDSPTGSLLPGVYGVSLYGPDASPRLADNPQYGLLLENEGVPDVATGMNAIAQITVTP
jgi:hypothetical protein